MLNDKLKELKEAKNMTVQEISNKSGIPASTVSRILSGQTESPYFANIADMVISMGGSLDAIMDIKSVPPEGKIEIIQLYERIIKGKNKTINYLSISIVLLVVFLIFLIVFDLLHPSFGLFR